MPTLGQRMGTTRYAADDAYRRGLEALARRDFDHAVDLMNQAIEALPSGAEYYAARGLIHLEEAEFSEAEADFSEALRHFKHEMLAHFGLGIVSFRRDKNYEAAAQHFLSAHYIRPERPETLFWLAVSYYHQGDLVQAANFMARADARFEQLNDKRRAETQRWVRELSKHAARPAQAAPAAPLPAPQARLPLPPDVQG